MNEAVDIDGTSADDESRAPSARETVSKNSTRPILVIFSNALKNFIRIDGAQRAGAIAHYAFFSLFPLIILFVTVASVFIDYERATAQIIDFVQNIVPITGDKQRYIVNAIAGAVEARRQAGVFAFLLLVWAALRFVATLIRATNRAWGDELRAWWRLPAKSLAFLAVIMAATPLSLLVPLLIKISKSWFVELFGFNAWIYLGVSYVIPSLILFAGLTLFYAFAPRRRTRLTEVWSAALYTTALLLIVEGLFGFYLKHFATLNAVYGVLGGIMALLFWIYISGCIFIFGACLCVALAGKQPTPSEVATTQPAG